MTAGCQTLDRPARTASTIAMAARNAAFYIQMGIVEQVRIGGGLERRGGAAAVALVARAGCRPARRPRRHARPGPALPGRGGAPAPAGSATTKIFTSACGADHGSDVAAVEHRARRVRRRNRAENPSTPAHLRDRRHHRGGLGRPPGSSAPARRIRPDRAPWRRPPRGASSVESAPASSSALATAR